MPVMPSFTWLLWGYASDWIYWIFFYIVSYTPYRVNITGSSGQRILVSALFFSTLGLCDFIHHDLDPIRPGWLHVCLSARTFDSMWFTGSQNGVKVLFFFCRNTCTYSVSLNMHALTTSYRDMVEPKCPNLYGVCPCKG